MVVGGKSPSTNNGRMEGRTYGGRGRFGPREPSGLGRTPRRPEITPGPRPHPRPGKLSCEGLDGTRTGRPGRGVRPAPDGGRLWPGAVWLGPDADGADRMGWEGGNAWIGQEKNDEACARPLRPSPPEAGHVPRRTSEQSCPSPHSPWWPGEPQKPPTAAGGSRGAHPRTSRTPGPPLTVRRGGSGCYPRRG